MKRVFCTLLIATTLVLAITGCDGQATVDTVTASLVSQVQTFIGDFARQALAAWLL